VSRIALSFAFVAVLGAPRCNPAPDPGGEPPAKGLTAGPPGTEVPGELVGAWEHGPIDLTCWENYKEGRYAGRNATPTREAMVFGKCGDAQFYRYEFAFGLYEELIDCEGTVAFDGDGTFTFTPVNGRKRHFDTRHPANNQDRPLTSEELTSPKLAGKRRYTAVASSDPPVLKITVPGSTP
jgi:hypothetical protein